MLEITLTPPINGTIPPPPLCPFQNSGRDFYQTLRIPGNNTANPQHDTLKTSESYFTKVFSQCLHRDHVYKKLIQNNGKR